VCNNNGLLRFDPDSENLTFWWVIAVRPRIGHIWYWQKWSKKGTFL